MENIKEYAKKLMETKDCIHSMDFCAYPHLTPQDIFEVMYDLEKENKVTPVLETRCPHCGEWTGNYYEAFWCLPKTEACSHCKKEFKDILTDNSYLVWKVCHLEATEQNKGE